ncbi:MAG: DNA-3-methyladenine glycosylase [Chitinophagaceae bacterium]|nr:MAG: DNA-3-methyladenine glycosylase [Chitinophagaceae bacterium]
MGLKKAFKKLPASFYRLDALEVARALPGRILVTDRDGIRTSGRIVEVEAYTGVNDRAAHSFGGRRTPRTEVMYAAGGVAYVYLCYGIHHLFNVVTGPEDNPQAVLIRGIEPLEGITDMLLRTGKTKADSTLTRGPGNVSRALGLHTADTRTALDGDRMFIMDDGFRYADQLLGVSPRIGVDYAGEDAQLPYRFYIKGNPYVSGKPR